MLASARAPAAVIEQSTATAQTLATPNDRSLLRDCRGATADADEVAEMDAPRRRVEIAGRRRLAVVVDARTEPAPAARTFLNQRGACLAAARRPSRSSATASATPST